MWLEYASARYYCQVYRICFFYELGYVFTVFLNVQICALRFVCEV